jgi:hypothetical protein
VTATHHFEQDIEKQPKQKKCETTRHRETVVRLQGPRPPVAERTGDFDGEGMKH